MKPGTTLLKQLAINLPVIGGPMYPCSNPELVAAVSSAGGMGVVQPVSLTYVYRYEFRAGLRYIRSLTDKPIGMNALIEQSSRRYRETMVRWIDIALEENIRFFITSLGKPDWVVKRVHAAGGCVYHDVTEKKWAQKALDCGVDGLVAVNNQAGGHAGDLTPEALLADLIDVGLPVVCAGGVSDGAGFMAALKSGYAGVQMGTRFIASTECRASDAYKAAVVKASIKDIVLSERITGVPVSLIRTRYVKQTGTRAGLIAKWMLKGQKTKHLMRTIYALLAMYKLKKSNHAKETSSELWQAGKSVASITRVESVATIMARLEKAYAQL
ncbi:MAG: nitronate monooxygenase [Gammaproteobacteria bacterium]|nr:nitronate monooxygenase [Gammaproteobacteria bacterium]